MLSGWKRKKRAPKVLTNACFPLRRCIRSGFPLADSPADSPAGGTCNHAIFLPAIITTLCPFRQVLLRPGRAKKQAERYGEPPPLFANTLRIEPPCLCFAVVIISPGKGKTMLSRREILIFRARFHNKVTACNTKKSLRSVFHYPVAALANIFALRQSERRICRPFIPAAVFTVMGEVMD